jgi:hypothetical protein
MPQANVLRVGCSLVEHWLFDSFWLIPGVSTARVVCGFRKSIGRVSWRGSGTLLGPEETDTGLFGVGCLQVAFDRACLVGGFGWAYGPVLLPYHTCTLGFVWGSGGLVVVWVGVRSCFENCIVNASIL